MRGLDDGVTFNAADDQVERSPVAVSTPTRR